MSWIYKLGLTQDELPSSLKEEVVRDRVFSVLGDLGVSIDRVVPEEVIRDAIDPLLGAPYKNPSIMRIDAPGSFSCSSFVSYVYTLAGIWMPSISVDKYVFGTPITREELRFGDLVFSNTGEVVATGIYYKTVEWMPGTDVPEGVDHLGIYLGDDKIVHASRSTSGVMIEDMDTAKNFGNKIVGFRRIADLRAPRYVVSIPDSFAPYQDKKNFISLLDTFGRAGDISFMKFDVPYFSQITDIGGDFWPARACGGVSLAMVLSYYNEYTGGKEGLQDFLDQSRAREDYVFPTGWFRGKLADHARHEGLNGEVKSGLAAKELAREIISGKLALISINKTILGRKRAHVVLGVGAVAGSDGSPLGFLIHDPESTSPEFGSYQFVSSEDLEKDWTFIATLIWK